MLNVNTYTNLECGHFLVILPIGASALLITAAACFVFSIRNFKLPLYTVGKKQQNDVVYTLDKAAALPAKACSGPPVDKAG
jgi:hypothetical protein